MIEILFKKFGNVAENPHIHIIITILNISKCSEYLKHKWHVLEKDFYHSFNDIHYSSCLQ